MPLTIKVNEFKFATIICSRNYLEELTLGFLASEGIFLKRNDLQSIHIDESKGFAHVKLTQSVGHHFEHPTKRVLASCCGKSRAFYFQNDAAIAKTSMTTI
ncbi:FdhD protein [Staphylococcus epidermidis]